MGYDAIILGAGGAGLFCAAAAGQRGRRILVIDHAPEPGRKILISGGGRCNFTNVGATHDRYLSENRHFARSALNRYTAQDFVALVDRYRIAWHEKTLGQLFCDGSARQIVAMLLAECPPSVEFCHGQPVRDVGHSDGRFTVTVGSRVESAPALVVATGGPSIPKLGATGFAYDLGRRFGMKVVEPRPALVPLTLPASEALFRTLAGVAAPVAASAGGVAFREAALFTHRGLSGPAILQASSYWRHRQPLAIDFLPDQPAGWLRTLKRDRPKLGLRSALGLHLPDRLAEALSERIGGGETLAGMRDAMLADVEARLGAWTFHPDGTEGFAKAEVTVGGIATHGLDQKTLAARHLPGLHFVGEAVDVTGWLGGYNFQWAWSSGWAAGQVL